jgi:hypothetical protein
MSAAARGRRLSESQKRAISEFWTGRKQKPRSDEYRAKLAASLKRSDVAKAARLAVAANRIGEKISETTRSRMREGQKRRWASEEERAAQSKRKTGTVRSLESRAKQSARLKIVLNTPEVRQRRSELGKNQSAEKRASIGEKSKAMWANPEFREKILKARGLKRKTT